MQPKDLLYLGLGAAFMAKDKIEELLDEIEEKGEISRDEAKRFVEDAKQRAEKEREETENLVKEKVKEAIAEMGIATKDDIAELKALLQK